MKTFLEWMESNIQKPPEAPNILWITGMGSQGYGAKMLAIQGYNVKQVGTITNYYAAGIGRIKRYTILQKLIGKAADAAGKSHLIANMQKHDMETQNSDFVPDVIIGASQGGAVAMQVARQYPHAKFVLIAPAWKIFNADPGDLPKDTIILQGKNDLQVPATDSQTLSQKYGFKVLFYDQGHNLPTNIVKKAVDAQLLNTRAAHLIPVPNKYGFNPKVNQ